MDLQVRLRTLVNRKYLCNKHSKSGFTLPEMLIIIVLIGILATLGISSWLGFVETQRLNTAQNEVYLAMRQAQREATKDKLTWQASFREQNGVVQWAVHRTVNPFPIVPIQIDNYWNGIKWNNLDSHVRLDSETNFQPSLTTVQEVKFDYKGNAKDLGTIALSSKSGGNVKRCVIVSTLLGSMRTAKEHTTTNNNKYCY